MVIVSISLLSFFPVLANYVSNSSDLNNLAALILIARATTSGVFLVCFMWKGKDWFLANEVYVWQVFYVYHVAVHLWYLRDLKIGMCCISILAEALYIFMSSMVALNAAQNMKNDAVRFYSILWRSPLQVSIFVIMVMIVIVSCANKTPSRWSVGGIIH